MKKIVVAVVVPLLLLILVLELALTVRQQSLTWDEGDHIFAGYQSWKTADFGYNPEHPPFVKELATIPMLFMGLKTPPPKGKAFFKDEAYFDGRDLIYDNGGLAVADKIIFRVRMMAALLSVLLGLLVFLAGREMFGIGAGLFALAIVVFDPNLIAHGAYVTTDMGISCFLFATVYALYRYVKRPTWGRLAIVGVATGFALASKHSAILLLPIVVVLTAVEIAWPDEVTSRREKAKRFGLAFVAAIVIGLPLLWSAYGFRYSIHPGGVPMKPSLAEYVKPLHGIEPQIYLWLAKLRVLPESYIYGLSDVRIVSNSFPTYIFGQIHAHGVPYYFPVAFVIKTTAGFMLLMLIAAFAIVTRRLAQRREIIFMAVPPLIYLAVAIGTGLNIGARHILPMYAFLAVLSAGAIVALAKTNVRWMYAGVALLVWHIASSLHIFPQYIAYSNEFAGGPSKTGQYLTDSNVDWGQQLKSVKWYIDAHNVKECYFGYFVNPFIDYRAYGIPCKMLPTADTMWSHTQVDTPERIEGPVFLSHGTLTGYEFGSKILNPYQQFTTMKPTEIIDYGVYVYNGSFEMRYAAAFGHTTRATDLLATKQLPQALEEAKLAIAIDPEQLLAQMILGDTLVAMGQKDGAAAAYRKSLELVQGMEPSAKVDWTETIEKKLKAL